MKRLRVTGILLFVCLFASLQLSAQTQATTGVIQGNVADPSGAILPGVSVEVRNTETNFTRQATTDESGRFVFLALQPGPYTVTVSGKQGFATLVQENLNLTVGQAITLNLTMKVSQGSEKVVVTDTPLVDAVKTESSSTLDQQAVEDTPTLGRKFEDFLTLTPGVSISQGPDGDEINFNGQRGIFNNISLDGGDYNNGFFGEQMGGQRAAIDITLDAVGEFQVVASGASAEFGRTAGGVVNVVTKSGTNQLHGSAFEFQRLEGLASNTSDGKPLKNFHREQFGGTIGGPIKKDKMFFFGAFEQIFENLQRPNLSVQAGDTACPSTTPDVIGDSALAANVDCQRLALLSYYNNSLGFDESKPVNHTINNSATLGKWDWVINNANKLSASYNFDYSKNKNQTFDVGTYGPSANGTEGPSKIQAINLNLFTTLSANKLNEAHFTYGRENRPREANGVFGADTGIGFAPSFRFGNPFFLQPNVDEIFWRTQAKDNFSIIKGSHNIKLGGEWIHSLNAQVFRGFFQGRYLFDSVPGFLRYTSSPAPNGFGPGAAECLDANNNLVEWVTYGGTSNQTCPANTTIGGPLLLYLQGAGLNAPATDAAGYSSIANEDLALFVQDKWQVTRSLTLSYGLRWEAQTFPDPVTPPNQTPYGIYLNDGTFPSNGKIPSQWKEFQPRLGLSWDIGGKGKSVLRASAGIYNGRQNMLTQVSAITTNGVQQQTLASGSFAWGCLAFGCYAPPTYPNVISSGIHPGTGAGVHVFDRNYKNPRIYSYNAQFEQEVARNTSVYVDFTWAKGEYLTVFNNWDRADRSLYNSAPNSPLGDLFVHSSSAHSDYKGGTFGVRKRMSNHFQMEANYVYSRDYDTDSNERDPFNDFSGPPLPGCDLSNLKACFPTYLDWAPSNRDERHKFNMYLTGDLPWHFQGNLRIQAHSAQPNATPRTDTTPRNFGRKDNAYSSVDWRLSRAFRFRDRFELTPMVEMFNTFNSKNNVNTLSAPALFDFNGFLRLGVGDPRQAQLSVKFTF